jgi:hypothetical protein
LREVVVGRHREQVEDAVELAADLAVTPDELRVLPEVAPARLGGIDRGLEEQLADVLERFLEVGVELRVDCGVLRREAGELRLGLRWSSEKMIESLP